MHKIRHPIGSQIAPGDRRFASCAFAVAVVLAGCAQSIGTMPARAPFARDASGPPSCKGQHTAKKYAAITATLNKKGGSFCIPAFGGFGGSMQYPGVESSVKLTIRTSTNNIYDEPQLGTGTSIVYLNLHFHAGTHFRSNLKPEGGLTSQAIYSGDTYTAYGIVAVGNLVLMFPPCYTVATQGPYGGVLPNLGDLFSDTTITGAGYGVIEIYSGEQVSQEC
jgi:hypothetical protein